MGSGKALRIGVDVDDVVADLLTAWLNRYNKANPDNAGWTPDDLTQWDIAADLGCSKDDIFKHLTPGIYDEVLPFHGVVEALGEIEALGHEVWFVTNCASNDPLKNVNTLKAKAVWLERYGLRPPYRLLVGCGKGLSYQSKNDVPVDWLIDDHIGNLEKFTRGYPVLVTRPHNRNLVWNGKRIKHLRDVLPLLKYGQFDPLTLEPSEPPACMLPPKQREFEASKTMYIPCGEPAPVVRQFETGATRDTDTGKLDYEGFLSPIVLKRFAEYMHKHRHQSDGTLRDSANWQKGIPVDAYMKSLARHFMDLWLAHRTGKPLPQEEACALLFNVQGLLFEELKPKTP